MFDMTLISLVGSCCVKWYNSMLYTFSFLMPEFACLEIETVSALFTRPWQTNILIKDMVELVCSIQYAVFFLL